MHQLNFIVCFLISILTLISKAQTFTKENIFLSGPVFTVHSSADTLFAGAGSALEIYKLETSNQLTYLGKAHTIDVVTSIASRNHAVYAGNNGIGFSVFDISNPQHPQLVSILYDSLIPGHHPPIIDQHHLFLSVGSYGIIVMDINNPFQPVEICRWKTPDFMLSIHKQGTTVLAADRTYGIILLHFDGQSLTPMDTINPFPGCAWYAFSVDEQNQMLWLYCYGSAIPYNNNVYVAALSLDQQHYLQTMGSFSFPSRPVASLTVRHQKAFMACWEQGLKIYDVANLNNPQLIHTIPTQSYTLWTHPVNDTLLAIAQYTEGVQLINMTHPSFPAVASIDHHGDIKSIAVSDSTIYSITLTNGVSSIAYHNNIFTEHPGIMISEPAALDITAQQQHLYVACDNEGLKVYKLNPLSTFPIWQQAIQGAIAVHTTDTLLFCVRSNYNWTQRPVELHIFNIKQPHAPMYLSSLQIITQNWPQDRPLVFMDVIDTLLAVSCWNDALTGSLHIYSIARPHQPQLLYEVIPSRIAQMQWIKRGSHVYLATARGTSALGHPNGLKFFEWKNNQLFSAGEYITGTNGNRTVGIACSGKYCFIAEGGLSAHGYVYMFEVDSSMQATLRDKIKIGSNTNHHTLKIWKNYLIHAAGSPGLMIFSIDVNLIVEPIADDYSPYLYPNPAHDYFTIRKKWKSLKIYDTNGRLITQYHVYQHAIQINHLSPGIYYIVFDEETAVKLIKF